MHSFEAMHTFQDGHNEGIEIAMLCGGNVLLPNVVLVGLEDCATQPPNR